MTGLKVGDFASREDYGVHLIKRALEFWKEDHWRRDGKDVAFVVSQLTAAASWAERLRKDTDQKNGFSD